MNSFARIFTRRPPPRRESAHRSGAGPLSRRCLHSRGSGRKECGQLAELWKASTEQLPDGEVGELVVRTPIMMKAELDRVVMSHPDVLEAAAIPVPSELGEDDILVAVIPRAGTSPSAEAIADWCRTHLAAIKVPRYIVFVGSLPHTPTHRVAKFKMRDDPTLKARAVDLLR